MTLKGDIEEYPEMWSKEIVAAVEDYKNGKWNSKRKLRKFVNREISQYYYNELIKRYAFSHRTNRAKRDREVSGKVKKIISYTLFYLSVIIAICILVDAVVIVKNNFWVSISAGYLFLLAFSYHYDTTETERKNTELKRENELLREKINNFERW